ncbi:MAG TPA: aspartate kinase [Sediminispirochaeta sp.]|nr:aspartate kinase [Sediminispirochaeta sp.]
MKVCKFGGSSVANADQIRKVKKIVESDPQRRVVVVSAPGKRHKEDEKITDMLYTCDALSRKGESIKETFGIIRQRFLEIASELQVAGSLKDSLDEIEQKIAAGAGPDYAASRGEYLSALMIAEFLGAQFVDAQEVVRLTDDGRVDESSYPLVTERLRGEGVKVMPGFYGATVNGELKTFSRGGSDISGAIAARGAMAEVYENWTDVSGILMADPRIVDDPKPIKEISYAEIREMASIGANVFHEEAIAPVKSIGVPINVKNTNDPSAPGTFIVLNRDSVKDPIVGVSGKKPYRKVLIEKFMLNRYPDFPGQVLKLLRSKGLSVDFELKGFDTLTLFVAEDQEISWEQLSEELKRELGADDCRVGSEVAMIGVVGEGLTSNSHITGAAMRALEELEIHVEGLNYGGSPITMLIAVPLRKYQEALKALAKTVAQV